MTGLGVFVGAPETGPETAARASRSGAATAAAVAAVRAAISQGYATEKDKVIVSNPDVKKPAAARYAWENFPLCNLYNGAGLPATPFRTDTWK